jgi:hypothetical protein
LVEEERKARGRQGPVDQWNRFRRSQIPGAVPREGFVEVQPLRLKRSAMHQYPNCAADSISARHIITRCFLPDQSCIYSPCLCDFRHFSGEMARLADTLCLWRRPGKSRQMQPHRSFAENPDRCRPGVVLNAVSRVGRSCEASRQSGRRSQALSECHVTHLCHRATCCAPF